MIEKVNTTKIRGEWQEVHLDKTVAGGNDTIQSIIMVADKLNEIIDWINEEESHKRMVKEDFDKYMEEEMAKLTKNQ